MEEQQQPIYGGVLDGIARLEDPRYREERHKLIVSAQTADLVDRRSLQCLVDFLDRRSLQNLADFLDDCRDDDSHEVVITELHLDCIRLIEPPDGGLQVLRDFFSRNTNTNNNTSTLTKVTLHWCNFGSQQDASRLLAAFHTNSTVTDVGIQQISNLEGAALGACLSGLIQNMPQLQRLNCWGAGALREEGVRAFQPALQANRTLKDLNLHYCLLGDDGIRLLADALVGNTTIEILDITYNAITSNGLADITWILESTRLKKFNLQGNYTVFGNESSTQRFARVLSRHEFLKELNLPACELGDGGIHLIALSLVGNTTLEVLDIRGNDITSNGLADITMLLESTQLKNIRLEGNDDLFDDEDSTQHFVSTLQHKKSSVQELPDIIPEYFPVDSRAATYAIINNSLTRNRQLNRVDLLLAPQQQQQRTTNNAASMMMLKTWHKAITKFAMVPNNAGASAIFKLFQARPALLEKRIKRPAATAFRQQQEDDASLQNNHNDNNRGGGTATTTTTIGGQKRRCL